MKTLIFLLLIFTPVKLYAYSGVLLINKTLSDIVVDLNGNVQSNYENYNSSLKDATTLLWKFRHYAFEPDIKVILGGFPHHHYYYSNIELTKPFNKLRQFRRKVEIWGQNDRTVIRVTIELDIDKQFRIQALERIKDGIIHSIERQLACKDMERLCKLAMIEPSAIQKENQLLKVIISGIIFVNDLLEYYNADY